MFLTSQLGSVLGTASNLVDRLSSLQATLSILSDSVQGVRRWPLPWQLDVIASWLPTAEHAHMQASTM